MGSGQVWLHDAQGASVSGPYQNRGPWNDGDFWSDIVLDEAAYITYEPAQGANQQAPFAVDEISHVLPGVLPFAEDRAGAASAAASCNLDSTCYPDWADVAKSVGRYLFERNGGSFFCSGTLLNTRNSSGIPYFLTANHCVDSDASARSVLMFWFYQTSVCNGAPPNERDVPRVLGSTLLSTLQNTRGDATLLRLASVPDGVTFAGWTTEAQQNGSPVIGIHHPTGDYKRISFGTLRDAFRYSGYVGENFLGAFWDGGGLTQGGSSGSGLFTSSGQLFGILSHGPKFDTNAQFCAGLPFADNYGKFSVFYPQIRDFLEERTTSTPSTPGVNNTDARALTSGTAISLDLAAVSSPTLLGAPNMFRIAVPAGSTRLDIRVTSNPNVNFAIYARLNNLPVVENGKVTADNSDESDGGNKTFSITLQSNPPLRAGTYYIRLGVFTTNTRTAATITATAATGGGPLTSGVPAPFRLGPVPGPTLAPYTFTINVPAGATKLLIEVRSQNPSIDVDLYVRYGQDIIVNQAGQVVADYRSIENGGNETIAITTTSSPPLRAGVYYIKVDMYQPNEIAQGTVTATVEGGTSSGSAQVDTFGTTLITSGQTVNLAIPASQAGTLLRGTRGYRIEVPQGATRLEVKLNMQNPLHDLDLYVRYNQDTVISAGLPVADYYSENLVGNESIVITPNSNPPLRAGVYFISIGVFTGNTAIPATLQATVTAAGQAAPNALTAGQARTFNLPAVGSATLFNGASGYTINVPANATQLEIRVNTATSNVDMDLYIRRASDVALLQGTVVSDRSDQSAGGNKSIVIRASDGLREGTYYIALLLYSQNRAVTGTITATIATSSGTATRTVLTPNRPAAFRVGPSSSNRLYNGADGFSIEVPEGISRVDIRLTTTTPNADLDLYARYGQDVTIENSFPAADHYSESFTGNELITISADSTPALKPGVYYIALGLFTPNVAAEGTVTAFLTGTGPGGTPPAVTTLTPGIPLRFELPAVEAPTVFTGDYSYKVEVPQGATQLIVRLNSDTPGVDTDLYVRAGQDVDVTDNGVTADYASTSRLANETIVIDASSTPPLTAGTYYISLSTYTLGARASGTISATIERPTGAAPISGARPLTSGTPVDFSLPAITAPVLLQGDSAFRIDVPPNATSLKVQLQSTPDNLDLDLHVRYAAEPAVVNGRITADYNSTGDTGVEAVTVDALSIPPLRAGTYFIAVSAWTPGIPIRGRLTATISTQRSEEAGTVELQKRQQYSPVDLTGPQFTLLPESKQPVELRLTKSGGDDPGLIKKRAVTSRNTRGIQ